MRKHFFKESQAKEWGPHLLPLCSSLEALVAYFYQVWPLELSLFLSPKIVYPMMTMKSYQHPGSTKCMEMRNLSIIPPSVCPMLGRLYINLDSHILLVYKAILTLDVRHALQFLKRLLIIKPSTKSILSPASLLSWVEEHTLSIPFISDVE